MASGFWAILVSPFVGSFLGVVVMRHASPKSIVVGRSHCDACNRALGIRDLVPVVSWLATGRRCRYCGVRLDWFYPIIEIAALAVALWAVISVPDELVWASCILGWSLLALAAIDIRAYRLPNFLTIPLMVMGIIVTAIIEPTRVSEHVVGAAAGYLFVVVIRYAYRFVRRREGIGLGDAKLLAAAGAWASWESLPTIVLIGAVSALAWAAYRSFFFERRSSIDAVPFGAFLCLGTWLFCLYGPLP